MLGDGSVISVGNVQAAAVKPKDTGPTPETLAEIQQKLEEAAILAAKHTAAASEEAAKKEAEANALAKKKGMPTLQVAPHMPSPPIHVMINWGMM